MRRRRGVRGGLARRLLRRPWARVASQAPLARTFDPALDPPVDALEEDRLRARPAAPDPSGEGGRVDEPESDAGQQEEEKPRVLRVERGAEEVEGMHVEVDEDRRVSADPDPGERGPRCDQRPEGDHASPLEATARSEER